MAQEVVYVSADQNGQGILRMANNNCYLISPSHVIGFASEVNIINSMRNDVVATMESEYPPDISVSKLKVPSSCRSQWPSSRWIKKDLAKIEESAIVTRQADGSLKRRYVLITEYDDMYIRVRPKFKDDSLFQGLSGSALVKNGKLLGQLMSIEANTNIGNVLRQDFIDGILKNRFGEGKTNYAGMKLNENILSRKWGKYGNNIKRGKVTIDKDSITIKYSGSGKDQIDIGIRQKIPINDLNNLRLSYDAKTSTYMGDITSYVVMMLSILDVKGNKIASIYSSPDKYLKFKRPTNEIKWNEGQRTWKIDTLYQQLDLDKEFEEIELSVFIITPKGEHCSRCKLELNDLRLFFEN
ncbi:MAG: hypothetical protein L3J83_01070 [Proteobacteria bacterium]|nr:hypothetical protein [Pseudomonadota bacterium]